MHPLGSRDIGGYERRACTHHHIECGVRDVYFRRRGGNEDGNAGLIKTASQAIGDIGVAFGADGDSDVHAGVWREMPDYWSLC